VSDPEVTDFKELPSKVGVDPYLPADRLLHNIARHVISSFERRKVTSLPGGESCFALSQMALCERSRFLNERAFG
jgi:hypothetical protein